jgi:hypothetical protein
MGQILSDDNPEYAFVHIPKNAGMSMMNAVKNCPKIKYFGHAVRFDILENYKEIIILRDPIERFTSAFFYLNQYKVNKERQWFSNPDELISSILKLDIRGMEYLKIHNGFHTVNGQQIPTDWVYHKQIAWVNNPYIILIYELLDDEIDKLNQEIGTNIKLPYINKSPNKKNFEYSKESLEFLNLVYYDDIKLYQSVLNIRNNGITERKI